MNSNDKTNFPHKLLLTNRSVANLRKAFASYLSANIKLSKTQQSQMLKSGGSLGKVLAPISRYWAKHRGGYLSFPDFWSIPYKRKISQLQNQQNDIGIKLWPVTKIDKRNKNASKNWRWFHVRKFWSHCHFFHLWAILSNPEGRYQTLRHFH